jgi:hypothetical protein
LNLAVLVSGGRTGSDFFQSLLDGHKEILSFPGIFYFDKFLKQLKVKKKNPGRLFIKMNEIFFDSRLNLVERHNQLGEGKNKFYKVNKKKFITKFNELYIGQNNNYELLKKLHLAYAYAKGEKLKSKKLIFLHIHHWYRLKYLNDLDYTLFYTLRDPLINLSSAFKNWTNYNQSKSFSFKSLCFYYDRIKNGIEYCNKFKNNNFYIIKLEDIHKKNKRLMNNFRKLFKLKNDKCLYVSTFHNKKWWGDAISNKYLNGINKNYNSKIDSNLFYEFDIKYLKSKMKKIYNNYYHQNNINNTKYFYRPLKMELLLLESDIKKFNLFSIFKFFFYSITRYKLLNKIIYSNYPKNLINNIATL